MQRGSEDLPALKRGRFQAAGLVVLWALAAALGHAQTTINVGPGQTYTTIQAGINAAVNGDTVLVTPGTYNENINFNGKAITVTSSGGAANTIIDGGATPGLSVVAFENNEQRTSVLANFTVRNGGSGTNTSRPGGGIYISQAAPTILNNVITANQCSGIYVNLGAALIQGNAISGTFFAANAYCAGDVALVLIGNLSSTTTLFNSVIGNMIENNTGDTAAAISIGASNGSIIVGNIIRNNVSTVGAVQMVNSGSIIFSQNLVYGNYAGTAVGYDAAGGLVLEVPSDTPPYYGIIANNTFANNTVSSAAFNFPASQVLFSGDVSEFTLVNNIVYGTGSYPLLICNDKYAYLAPTPMLVENNDLFNPSGPTYDSSCANSAGMAGNIAVDPLFKNPAGNDFHLQSGSPAIDAGNNQALTMLAPYGVDLTTDLDGNPRVQNATGNGCIIDMGAYEYPGTLSECGTTETLISSLNPATAEQSVTFTVQLSAGAEIPTGAIQFLDGANLLLTQTVSGTGSAAFATNSLAVGSHTITANYQPTGTFGASTASLTQVINGDATSTTFISSLNPANAGQSVTFTATVTSSQGTPTGTVTFTDGTTTLSTANLVTGVATFNSSTLSVGSHSITATYNASGSFAESSANLTETINGLADTTTLTGAPNPALVGGAVNLTATVTAASGTPAGTVMFYDGGALLGTATVSGGSAEMSTAFSSAGTHDLTANYSGDTSYSPSTGAFAETLNLNPTTMTDSALPSPSIAFQPTVFGATVKTAAGIIPTGTVIFTANGAQIGSGTLQDGSTAFSTSALTAGSYQIVASYAGDSASGPSSAAPFTLVVAQQSSQVHLASSLNPAPLGASVSFTAAVSAAGQFSGTVQFYDGAAPLGSPVTVNAQGVATYATGALALGTHNITAKYSGDANTVSSVSAVLQQTIVPYVGDFSIAVTPTAMSIYAGESSSLHVTVASIGGFNEPVSLSCGNLPAATTCSFSTSSLPNGQGTATVVIQTAAPQPVSANSAAGDLHRGPGGAGKWALALLAIFFVPRRWRRGVWMSLPGFCILIAANGCSAPKPIVGGTPPGTYQISITAAYTAPAPPLVHSATVSLAVNSLF